MKKRATLVGGPHDGLSPDMCASEQLIIKTPSYAWGAITWNVYVRVGQNDDGDVMYEYRHSERTDIRPVV